MQRPLGLPTIKDRVVQTAAKRVLEPIFEADMEDCAYGYRPKRSAMDAVKAVHGALIEGSTQVVDADLSKFFDKIPRDDLMRSIALRIVDRAVLSLLTSWLQAPVQSDGPQGPTMSAGKASKVGTLQGGHQPDAGQPLHESVLEALEAQRGGAEVCGTTGDLCG